MHDGSGLRVRLQGRNCGDPDLHGPGQERHGEVRGRHRCRYLAGSSGRSTGVSCFRGAAAYILGYEEPIATFNHTCSYTSDTPDFWRREGQAYPSHGGRFTGEPAYFKHIEGAGKLLLEQTKTRPKDFDYAIFHQPNGKFPQKVAKPLGFNAEQIRPGSSCRESVTLSGAAVGLAATFDVAKPGERIFVCSFGSGAGGDAFDITVTDNRSASYDRAAAPTGSKRS